MTSVLSGLHALFAGLDTEERAKLAAEGKAKPDGSYPIRDRKDLKKAIKAYGRGGATDSDKAWIMRRARALGAIELLPSEWVGASDDDDEDQDDGPDDDSDADDTANHSGHAVREPQMLAVFAAGGGRQVQGNWAVYPSAPLFVAGDYQDKNFSLSQAEMAAAARMFRPVGGNIEHTPFMNGRAFEIRSVQVDASDPTLLRGEVAVPIWLDENLAGHERGLSMEWDRRTKRLVGAALTVNPRVPAAALMSAYSAFTASHDPSDDAQPPAAAERNPLPMSTREKFARWIFGGGKPPARDEMLALFEGDDEDEDDTEDQAHKHEHTHNKGEEDEQTHSHDHDHGASVDLDADDHDEMVHRHTHSADMGAAPPRTGGRKKVTMSANTSVEAELEQIRREKIALERELTAARMSKLAQEGEAFFDELVRTERADPSEHDNFMVAFNQAGVDDMNHDRVTFGTGTTTRVEMLKRREMSREEGLFSVQHIKKVGGEVVIYSNQRTPEKKGDEATSDEAMAQHWDQYVKPGQPNLANPYRAASGAGKN